MLGLLCLMYLITYVDRVNIATAAPEIKRELALSNTQLAFVLSAFGYPYIALSDLRWLAGRSRRAEKDALRMRADLGVRHDPYRLRGQPRRRCSSCG